jgi:hypothetical protein
MGFAVDVTDYRNTEAPSAAGYDLLIGQDVAYAAAVRGLRRQVPPRVHLGTGAEHTQAIAAERARMQAARKRRGFSARRRYRTRCDLGPGTADAVFYIGDDWVAGTYRKRSNAALYEVPNSVTPGVATTTAGKDWAVARKHFLWLASYAAVHRGLDLLLEATAALPECHLWICGSVGYETDFVGAYAHEFGLPNVHLMGWVDVTGSQFAEITHRCGYTVYPSASDGMPGSVINAMAAGLVPLITPESGMDTGGLGAQISSLSVTDLVSLMRTCSEVEPDSLREEAERVIAFTNTRYSEAAHVTAIRAGLEAVLSTHGMWDRERDRLLLPNRRQAAMRLPQEQTRRSS